jgi:peptidoglycan hydrolase CwlO-like protein
MTHPHETDQAKKDKVGLTNRERAEHRRRIAECRYEIAKLRDEIATLEADLADDKKNHPAIARS